jgi:4'-phosphopantetheinyl transferase
MIIVYYTIKDDALPSNILAGYMNSLPPDLSRKISTFSKQGDVQSSLLAKLLLQIGLKDLAPDRMLSELKYTHFNRPYFENAIDFNISHSGNCVACAFALHGKVGIDVEQLRPLDIATFRTIFTDEEWHRINSTEDTHESFFSYWTAKESILKAEGSGLNMPFKDVEVKNERATLGNDVWYCKKLLLEKNYIMHVASDQIINEVLLRHVVF